MPRRPASSAREEDGDKHRGHTFAAVEAIGRALPDVEVTTAWGQPALKVHGKMFVCIASHKSAEPNSLVVMMAFADRDALVEDDPATYYLKETLPEPPVCARETDPHSSRRSSGPRGRRTPLRQRPDAEQVGRRQPPRHGSAITRSPLIDHESLDRLRLPGRGRDVDICRRELDCPANTKLAREIEREKVAFDLHGANAGVRDSRAIARRVSGRF